MTTKIGSLIKNSLADGKVSMAEVDGLIKQANADGKLTKGERDELSKLLAKGDKFESAAAKEKLAKLLGVSTNPATTPTAPSAQLTGSKFPTVTTSADPKVFHEEAGKLTYQPIAGGQLFVDGVNGDDIEQGYLGDCFLAASLSSVAYADPKLIENAIQDNKDGTFTVRFYQRTASGSVTPKYVRVDSDFPTAPGYSNPRYARCRDGKEMWVSIMEKAYACFQGSYDTIGNGGAPGDVMSALTGKSSTEYMVKSSNKDVLFAKLTKATQGHIPASLVTYGEEKKDLYNSTGMHAWHTYSILGTSEEGGVKYVQLRNPWGSSEPSGDGVDDGVFNLKLDDFMKLAQAVSID